MNIVQSTVKDFALRCSKEMRAGKFERVGQDFLDEIDAELEAIIRRIAGEAPDRMPAVPDDVSFFVQSEVMPKIAAKLNAALAHVIARKVHRQPSVGVTLRGLNS